LYQNFQNIIKDVNPTWDSEILEMVREMREKTITIEGIERSLMFKVKTVYAYCKNKYKNMLLEYLTDLEETITIAEKHPDNFILTASDLS
jgi:hypothetical protein